MHLTIDSFGLPLIHFVWQGVAIGLVVAMAMMVIRSPRARYLIGCAGLVALVLAPIMTFVVLLPRTTIPPATTIAGAGGQSGTTNANSSEVDRLPAQNSAAKQFLNEMSGQGVQSVGPGGDRLDAYMIPVVAAWAVGVAALLLRQLITVLSLNRLARDARPITDPAWTGMLAEVCARLDIPTPRLLVTTSRRIPAVVFAFRPAILWPAAMLTGLSPEQVKAILAHELAHIGRRDYLINILQTFVETVLFYHPTVWWLNKRIREEREFCADDRAVAVSGGSSDYLDALLKLASPNDPRLATAGDHLDQSMGGNGLRPRFIRLVYGTGAESGTRYIFPTLLLLILMFFIVAAPLNPAFSSLLRSPTRVSSQIDLNSSSMLPSPMSKTILPVPANARRDRAPSRNDQGIYEPTTGEIRIAIALDSETGRMYEDLQLVLANHLQVRRALGRKHPIFIDIDAQREQVAGEFNTRVLWVLNQSEQASKNASVDAVCCVQRDGKDSWYSLAGGGPVSVRDLLAVEGIDVNQLADHQVRLVRRDRIGFQKVIELEGPTLASEAAAAFVRPNDLIQIVPAN